MALFSKEDHLRVLFVNYFASSERITKTYLYNFDPLNHHYIVKLGFTGVYIIFLTSAKNIVGNS